MIQMNDVYSIVFLSILGLILLLSLIVVNIFHVRLKKQTQERIRRKSIHYSFEQSSMREGDEPQKKTCCGFGKKKPEIQVTNIAKQNVPKRTFCMRLATFCRAKI